MSAEDQDKTEVEETPETEAEQTPAAEEPVVAETAEEQPAAEAEEPVEAPAAAPAPPAEPEVALGPKEARRRTRSAHSGPAGEPRDAEQRQADRDALRRQRATRRSAYRKNARARAAKRREAEPAQPPLEPIRQAAGQPKLRQGVVVSDRPDKTIVVRVDLTRRHRRYGKTVRASSTLHVHDESNDARAGDTVRVLESRPLSKTKRWRLVEVVERAR